MNFCVAEVNLNLVLHFSDGEMLKIDNVRNIESYLDNQFWKTAKYSVENTVNIYPIAQLPAVGGEIMNISRYEGHRYAFEIHQYT